MKGTERQRVLIVDDEKFNRQNLADLLRGEYDVLLARDGEQALARAGQAVRPDLILLDVVMPGMDGYEVMRRLKEDERTRGIPVVFVTGLGAEEDEEKGLAMGAVDYVSKPFRPAIILARVRNHMSYVWQRKQLEQSARVDALTQIPNRRSLDLTLETEWERALRTGGWLSAAVVDVDFFKQYNDHYGHGAGDDALRQVARVLERNAQRPQDLAARYGGEEFVLLLPETDVEGAHRVAEKARIDVESLAIPHQRSAAAAWVTVSIGGATMRPSGDMALDTLLKAADEALYQAKGRGRNRCVWTTVAPT